MKSNSNQIGVALILAVIGITGVMGTGVLLQKNSRQDQTEINPKSTPASITPQSPTAKEKCGDSTSPAALAWYPVFLDKTPVNTVQRTICRDAVATTRQDTGKPSVQVASFSSYDRAKGFAQEIGGQVGVPTLPEGALGINKNDIEKTLDQAGIEIKLKLSEGFGNVMFQGSAPSDGQVEKSITIWGSDSVSRASLLLMPKGGSYDRVREVDKFYISTFCKAVMPDCEGIDIRIEQEITDLIQKTSNQILTKTITYRGRMVEINATPWNQAATGEIVRVIAISISP